MQRKNFLVESWVITLPKGVVVGQVTEWDPFDTRLGIYGEALLIEITQISREVFFIRILRICWVYIRIVVELAVYFRLEHSVSILEVLQLHVHENHFPSHP